MSFVVPRMLALIRVHDTVLTQNTMKTNECSSRLLRDQRETRNQRKREQQEREREATQSNKSREAAAEERKAWDDERKRKLVAEYR